MTDGSVVALAAAVAPLLPLGIGLYNRLTWPRLRPGRSATAPPRSVSVLIPARNEAANIRAAVESVLEQGELVREVLVYSDESTDETDAIVRSMQAADARVRLIVGEKLPAGWVGKPHACHVLGTQAEGSWLLFLDADVRLQPGALAALPMTSPDGDDSPDVLTFVPRQLADGFWLNLLQPLLLLTYVSWLPLAWSNRRKSTRFLAGCGQLLLVRRPTFELLGGFSEVRGAVVDDMEFCRRARLLGARVAFFDGYELASCRMYESASAFWAGFAKNVFLGLRSELNLALALALHFACFLLPYVLLGVWLGKAVFGQPLPTSWLALSCFGVASNVLHRAVLAERHGHGSWAVILHPLAVLILLALALESWRRARLVGIEWSGRSYEGRVA